MQQNKIKVSVIIPVYNAKDYIEKCLDSVVNQTLKDIEIICVNDCSKDNSLEILQSCAKKDERIKVIDCKKNGGESKARNVGLDNAQGEFVAFVDNDDTIDPDFCEKLYAKAIETGADIVKADVEITQCDGKIDMGELNKKILQSGNKWHFRYEWWCAIYKKEMVDKFNLRLPEGKILGGDCLFLHYAIEHCNKLEVINNTFYRWKRRENSGESKILSYEKVKSALEIFDEILDNSNKMLENSIINIETYQIMFEACMWIAVDYIFRNDNFDSKKLCIKYFINFVNKCKSEKVCKDYILNYCSCFADFIKNKDEAKMFDLVLKFKNKKEFDIKNIIAGLRNRVKANA